MSGSDERPDVPPVRDAGRARARRDDARDGRRPRVANASAHPAGSAPRSRGGAAEGEAGDEADRSVGGAYRRALKVSVGGASIDPATGRPRRDKIHSILSALPVLMLVVGLYLYYSGERAQSVGAPIVAESVAADGVFSGLSLVKSGGAGRHYLWFDDGERVRGVRVRAAHRAALEALGKGDEIALALAPTVPGSTTLWAWRVERDGVTLIDDSSSAR